MREAKKMKFNFSLIFMLLLSITAFTQHIENIKVIQEGDIILLTYDLIGENEDQTYDIKVKISENNDKNYLINPESLSGDIVNVGTGIGKKITWDVLNDRETLIGGNFIFKLEATQTIKKEGTFIDVRDGNVYKWVKIGDQIWMAENLAYLPNQPYTDFDDTKNGYYIYNEGANNPFLFEDNFSSNQQWNNSHPADFKSIEIEGNQVLSWKAKRFIDQEFYKAIDPFEGNFELSFDFKVTSRTNNCWLELGLVSEVDGNKKNKAAPSSGNIVTIGWTGGGTPYSVYYIKPVTYSKDGLNWTTDLGDINPNGRGPNRDGYISYSKGQWYSLMMNVDENKISIQLFNHEQKSIVQKSWKTKNPITKYQYLYIGNSGLHDHPSMTGYIDNISLKRTGVNNLTELTENNLNYKKYGVLYNWNTAKEACPNGWHLPTHNEWNQLTKHISDHYGGYSRDEDSWSKVGTHLKATNGWENGGEGSDDFGFSALPAGYLFDQNGKFRSIGKFGLWWSATRNNNGMVWYRALGFNYDVIVIRNCNEKSGYSVRCVKD